MPSRIRQNTLQAFYKLLLSISNYSCPSHLIAPEEKCSLLSVVCNGVLVPEYMLVSPTALSISHAVFSISAVVSRQE